MADNELVMLYQGGDNAAIGALITRHKESIHDNIRFIVKDTHLADDLFQDTVIRIMDKLKSHTYQENGKFIKWALWLSRNVCIDYYRRLKNKHLIPSDGNGILEDIIGYGDNAEASIIKKELYQQLTQAINGLNKNKREVVVLRYYGDFSFKKIASVTNMKLNTALANMNYAKSYLNVAMTQ